MDKGSILIIGYVSLIDCIRSWAAPEKMADADNHTRLLSELFGTLSFSISPQTTSMAYFS